VERAAHPNKSAGSSRVWPAVDDRLVMPETRYEVIEGRVRYVSPADAAHGTRHSKISALLEAYVRDSYEVASDMLTRTSEIDDLAPDASVFPSKPDPNTGGRRLEELAFEVVSTTRLGRAAKKARRLSERGARCIFAIDVKSKRALAWSPKTNTWEMLPPDGAIDDPVFVKPLAIAALVTAAKADDAVAEALLAKKNPVLLREGKRRHDEGRVEAKAEDVLSVLAARQLTISKGARDQIRAMRDTKTLDRWLRHAVTCTDVRELFGKQRRATRAR